MCKKSNSLTADMYILGSENFRIDVFSYSRLFIRFKLDFRNGRLSFFNLLFSFF